MQDKPKPEPLVYPPALCVVGVLSSFSQRVITLHDPDGRFSLSLSDRGLDLLS